jgi:uncharacterized protein (DUF697 family)
MMREEREARQPLRDVYFRAAHPHIVSYAMAAGAAAAVPVPLVDLPLLLGIQAKMYHTLASIYGQRMSSQRMAEIGSALGVGFLARTTGRELLKLVPGLGSAVSAVYAGASTYALGCTLCAYFSLALRGDVPDPKQLRELYEQEYAKGREHLREFFQAARQFENTKTGEEE